MNDRDSSPPAVAAEREIVDVGPILQLAAEESEPDTKMPPEQDRSSMSDLSERRDQSEPPAVKRGTFGAPTITEANSAGRLTRLGDGSYTWGKPMVLELGGTLVDEPAGYRGDYDGDNDLVKRWVEKAREKAVLRRCKPMIARLRKEFGERVAREQAAQAAEFRECLRESHHADAGDLSDRGYWAGISINGAYRARELAVDIEVWNALQ